MGDQNSGAIQQWLVAHPFVTYLFIVVCMIYIFNAVFRPRKLPLLKDVLVYGLILAGGFMLLFFQTKVGLPIVHGFAVAILLMLTVRIRSLFNRRGSDRSSGQVQSPPAPTEPQVRVVSIDEQEQAGERR